MRLDGPRRTKSVVGLVVLLAALIVATWQPGARSTFWQGIEGRLVDARFALRGPRAPPDGVAILAIDDATIAELGEFPPSRASLAGIVNAAADGQARAVALDLLLVDTRPDDDALIDAMGRVDTVLGVAEAADGADLPALAPGRFALTIAPLPDAPLPALGPAPALAAIAELGHVTVRHDTDGTLRRLPPALAVRVEDGTAWYPGLAVAALATRGPDATLLIPPSGLGGHLRLGDQTFPLDRNGAVPLRFYGGAGAIPTYSAAHASEADLAGRVVFVGPTAIGFGDQHSTPFDPRLPGVELHATLAANLLEGRVLHRDAAAWGMDFVVALLAAMAGFAAAGLARPWLAATALVATAATLAIALQLAFAAGWWLDASTALLSLLIGGGAGGGLSLITSRQRAANLARYQSPALIETLAAQAHPSFGAADRPAVVLFADVEGFTGHAETLTPERTEAFLRGFHEIVERAAAPGGGMIAHFAGDGVMLVFGLHEAGRAEASAALTFIDALYAALGADPDWPGLRVRVSGHIGPVRLGIVGAERHRHVSVTGDVVNIASRLQDLAKLRGTSVALSDALLQSSPEAMGWAEAAGLTCVRAQTMRGRKGQLDVWTGTPSPA